METNYSWSIDQMNVKKKVGDLNNVVIEIYWTRKATLVCDNQTYTAIYDGYNNLSNPSQENFTTYEDLTFEEVCKWIEKINSVILIDDNLKNQLISQTNVIVKDLNFPWNNK